MAVANTYFYTTPIHDRAIVNEATNNTGKENVLDPNLGTYHQVNTLTIPHFIIDIYPGAHSVNGAAPTSGSVDAAGIVIYDYNNNYSSATLSILGSDDNNTFTAIDTPRTISTFGPLSDHQNLFAFEFTAAKTYRYYKFRFIDLSTMIKINYGMLLTKRTLTTRPKYSKIDGIVYHNTEVQLNGGFKLSRQDSRIPTLELERDFSFISTGNLTVLQNVVNDSANSLRYMIYIEDEPTNVSISLESPITSPRLCWFNEKEVEIEQTVYEHYAATLNFVTPGFIDPEFNI